MYKESEHLKLFPVGSRVECGNRHRGRLVAYFTGVGPNDYHKEIDLFGVIALDEEYITGNGTHVAMLVVHHANLDLYNEESIDFLGDFERDQIRHV